MRLEDYIKYERERPITDANIHELVVKNKKTAQRSGKLQQDVYPDRWTFSLVVAAPLLIFNSFVVSVGLALVFNKKIAQR